MKSKWELVEHYIDKRVGFYVAKYAEPESEAEHRLQIAIGHDHCAHCGHVRPKTNLGHIDAHAIRIQEHQSLQLSHDQMDEWAARLNIPVRHRGRR